MVLSAVDLYAVTSSSDIVVKLLTIAVQVLIVKCIFRCEQVRHGSDTFQVEP